MVATVRGLCSELLPGFPDEDILEYIVGALEEFQSDGAGDAGTQEETVAMVSSFLESAGYLEDSEEAAARGRELVARIASGSAAAGGTGGGGADDAATAGAAQAGAGGANPSRGVPQKLSDKARKLTLQLGDASLSESAGHTGGGVNRNSMMDDTPPSDRDVKQAKKRDEKASRKQEKQKKYGKLTAAELAEQQALEVEAELTAARIAAVQARTKLGAYKGALDAQAFTLPNPGGGQPLLEDASCRLVWGRRYALIGRNGMGKSTLLRAFASRRVGEIPENVTVHYVSQEVNLTAAQSLKTPVEIVVDADVERTLLNDELADLEGQASAGQLDSQGSKRHGEVLARLEEIGADSAPRRAEALLETLGFSKEFQQRPLSQLSGGWRVRTMLGAALFAKSDLLLLDEPTNHLSLLATFGLAKELVTSETWKQRIVVIVSHDRHFLDEVCTDCLHISGAARRLTQSRGNYTVWAKRRADEIALFTKEQEKRQREIDSLREYAGHGFKYGGSASQINKMGMKAKQADKLEEVQSEQAEESRALLEDMELPMKICSGGELDGYVVQLINVGFGYPNATPPRLFQHCEFGITSKSRIVLLGENGNGKTTLVKLIMGDLQPSEGEIKRNPHARFALVNQHHADQIDLSLTPLEFLQKLYPGDGSYDHTQVLRGHLSNCGVTSGSSVAKGGTKIFDLQNTPCSALSGGQRSRVALSAVSFARPHVLVLDEPTNNLDLESVATLAETVQRFEGAVICVSHDQFFVQAVANEAWVVNDGKVKQVSSFSDYRQSQLKVLNKSSS